jgi:chromosome segregation ATPase
MPVWEHAVWIEPDRPSREVEYDMAMKENDSCNECGELYECYLDALCSIKNLNSELEDMECLNELITLALAYVESDFRELDADYYALGWELDRCERLIDDRQGQIDSLSQALDESKDENYALDTLKQDYDKIWQENETLREQAKTIRFLLDKMCS